MNRKSLGKDKRGVTLLEVLLAVFILAIVILPMMGMFTQSTKTVTLANSKTQYTYMTQAKLEEQYKKTYAQLFTSLPNHSAFNSYFYSIQSKPSGAINKSAFGSSTPAYAHLFVRGKTIVFSGPDGSYTTVTSTSGSASFTLSVSGNNYSLTGDVTASGTKPSGSALGLIVNCPATTFAAISIAMSGVSACALYETPDMSKNSLIGVSGASNQYIYANDVPPTTALVNVACLLYTTSTATVPVCITQDTMEVSMP